MINGKIVEIFLAGITLCLEGQEEEVVEEMMFDV